jgi:hypothetical protein
MHLIIGLVIGLFNLIWAGVSLSLGQYEWVLLNVITGVVVITTTVYGNT